jgi:uncharacterized protein YeaO (DUF488 family)
MRTIAVANHISRNVRMKRVYDPPSPEDGYRILITRYWPRGIKREAVDENDTKLAPSRELLREFKHEGLPWKPYRQRYLAEMQSEDAQRDIERLAKIARARMITLMCICEDENRCHRGLLRELIAERIKKGAAQRPHHRGESEPRTSKRRGNPKRRAAGQPRAVQAQPAGGAGCPPSPHLGRVGGQDYIPQNRSVKHD